MPPYEYEYRFGEFRHTPVLFWFLLAGGVVLAEDLAAGEKSHRSRLRHVSYLLSLRCQESIRERSGVDTLQQEVWQGRRRDCLFGALLLPVASQG